MRYSVLAVLTALACGEATAPTMDWMRVDTDFALVAYFVTDYNCDPAAGGEVDLSLCADETGLIAMSRDTLTVAGTIDTVQSGTFGPTGTATFSGTYASCLLVETFRGTGCATVPVGAMATIRRIDTGRCGNIPPLAPCENGSRPWVTFFATVALSGDSVINQYLLISFGGEMDAGGAGGTLGPPLGEGPVFIPQRLESTVTWRLDIQ